MKRKGKTKRAREVEEDYFAEAFTEAEAPEEAYDKGYEVLLPHCKKAKALPWPDDVPILTAEDIVVGGGDGAGKKLAVWQWFRKTFPAGDEEWNTMRDIVMYQWGNATAHNGFGRSMMEVALTFTASVVAAFWNDTLRRCGYDVPEDKCRVDQADEGRVRKKARGRKKPLQEAE